MRCKMLFAVLVLSVLSIASAPEAQARRYGHGGVHVGVNVGPGLGYGYRHGPRGGYYGRGYYGRGFSPYRGGYYGPYLGYAAPLVGSYYYDPYYRPVPVVPPVVYEQRFVPPRALPEMPSLSYFAAKGQSEAQTTRDRLQCERWAWNETRPDRASALNPETLGLLLTRCMRRRGYDVS
jgi:hypothetical protein